MPSGGVRVDENTLGFAKEADDFLSIASAGLSSRDIPVFWRELSCDPERVQSFVVCLIVKLIALDGGQAKLTLSKNYCEICGLDVDVNSIKTWMAKEKAFDQERKHLSLLLQHQIISTLYYLGKFYPHLPSNHLKNIHIRWNLARNCVKSEGSERCDAFEVMVMKVYFRFGAEVPKVINPILLEGDCQLTELLEACYKHHRRGQLGYLPSKHSKLCNYQDVADSLSFYRLQFIVSGCQTFVSDTMTELVSVLKKCALDTADYGERETLLPILQLLRLFITEAVKYSTADVYRAMQPFYLWPAPHSEVAKSLLDVIQTEDVIRGSHFRKQLMAENHSELNLNWSSGMLTQRHYHHMLIDTRASRSYAFNEAFENQDPLDPISLKKLLLRNLFYCLLNNVDLVQLDEQLEAMINQLDGLCDRALDITLSPCSPTSVVSVENKMAFMVKELDKLYSEIMSYTSGDLLPEHVQLTQQQLEDFSLPVPYIHTHSIVHVSTEVFKDKLREVISHTSGKTRRKKFSGRRYAKLPSQESDTVDRESVSSPDDVITSVPHHVYTVRPASAPSSRLHSVVEADHGGTASVPSSPLHQCVSPSSLNAHISFSSGSQQELSDGLSESEPSGESDSIHSTSTSRSTSLSPTNSDSSSFLSSISSLPRNSIPIYGSGNMVGRSFERRSSTPSSGMDGITRTGTLVRVQKKGGTHTIRVRRKSSSSQFATAVTKVLKIVLAGDDRTVSSVASAYADLRINEPSLFAGLQVQFYYVPLSEVSTATLASLSSLPHRKSAESSPDHLMQPLIDGTQPLLYGEDVWLGCFVGNMDSWYEKNVLLATHNLLRIIPAPETTSRHKSSLGNSLTTSLPKVNEKLSPSPAQLLRSVVSNYCREAQNMIHFNMYSVELEVKPDKLGKQKFLQLPQEMRKCYYMLQRLDMQRCVKGKQVKTFEAKVTIEEVTLDCSMLKQRTFSVKSVWSVGVASVPRAYDLCFTNPENDNMELTVTQAGTEGRMSTAHKLSDENSYHVKYIELEMKEKPISVMIDSDPAAIIENVTRVKVWPAMAGETEGSLMNSLTAYEQQQAQKQVSFPIMSFWPVDL